MQTAPSSRAGEDTTPSVEKASTLQWSWIGQLHGGEEEVPYYAIINIESDEGIHINLSDGKSSYTRTLSRHELLIICESPSLAHVDPRHKISRIQAALKSDEKEAIRLVRTGENLELHISVRWGSEFGDLSIMLDIAAITLDRSAGNGQFLNAAIERIAKSRAHFHELQGQGRKLKLEVDELWEAKKRLDVISRRRNERMQIFADTLNEYKRKVSLESTK